MSSPADLLFYILAALTIASAAVVALGRNIVHSVFFLLVAFTGVAGLFVLLHADFLAAVQVIVYVGGILVLILFAVMMTRKVHTPEVSNESVGLWRGVLLGATALAVLLTIVLKTTWHGSGPVGAPAAEPDTVAGLGQSLLGGYLFPFEVASVVLLAALVAAAILVRKEVRGDDTAE